MKFLDQPYLDKLAIGVHAGNTYVLYVFDECLKDKMSSLLEFINKTFYFLC